MTISVQVDLSGTGTEPGNLVHILVILDRNTSLVAPGALAHRLQRRTTCNTSPPALSKMVKASGIRSNLSLLDPPINFR